MCLCAVLGLALVLPALTVPARAQSNDVLNRLSRIENDIDTLNRAVYKGEKPPASAASGAEGGGAADLELRISQLETELRNLTGKVEQLGYDNQQLQQRLDALSQDARTRLDALEAHQTAAAGSAQPSVAARDDAALTNTPPSPSVNAPAVSSVDPNLPAVLQPPVSEGGSTDPLPGSGSAVDAATLYEQGFAQIKAQDYASAEKSFADFMKKYPDHSLAPNALYWLGETFYARKLYDKAAVRFAEAYKKYPNGPKGADNLLKLALSLAGKGQKDNACIALGQLKKEYAKGPAPVLARGDQEMKTLGCP